MDEFLNILSPHTTHIKTFYLTVFTLIRPFPGSSEYWKKRYRSGANSGPGSYSKLAEFKAEVVNDFVEKENISSVIEYGCGDGNQLKLAEYPGYIGFDISEDAIERCKSIFAEDSSKTFRLMEDYDDETAELALSMEVIFHLTEDESFNSYMQRLFDSSDKFVIIYSSNTDEQKRVQPPYVKHRKFSSWIKENAKEWVLREHIPNKYPYDDYYMIGSYSDFYIYEKTRD